MRMCGLKKKKRIFEDMADYPFNLYFFVKSCTVSAQQPDYQAWPWLFLTHSVTGFAGWLPCKVGCQPYARSCFWSKHAHCTVLGKIMNTVEILVFLRWFWYHIWGVFTFLCAKIDEFVFSINSRDLVLFSNSWLGHSTDYILVLIFCWRKVASFNWYQILVGPRGF